MASTTSDQPPPLAAVLRLADTLGAATDADALARFNDKIAFDDLDDPAMVPLWLPDALDALVTGRDVPPWRKLDTTGDMTEPLDFFRTLDQILPVEIIDVGDNYTAIARQSGYEAVVALVGHGYCVRPIQPENA